VAGIVSNSRGITTVTGSGSLGGTPFTDALITLTANADTANVTNTFSGQLFLVNNASTTVDVAGIGPGIFTEVITTSVYHPNQTAGISDPSAGILDVVNPVFATYDLTTSVGPVSGSAHFNIGLVFPTTAGNFEIDSTSGQGTFQATSVPEPATLTLTAIGAFGLLFYRLQRPARAVAPPVARESGTC